MNYINLFSSINNSNCVLVVSQTNLRKIVKIKSELEKQNKQLYQFKIISTEELIDKLSFTVKDDIFLFNLNNNINISETKALIKFSKYNTNQLNKLNNFTKNNNEFLIKHDDFLKTAKSLNFHILDNPIYLEPLLKKHHFSYQIISFEINQNINIKKFRHVEDELIYLFNDIATKVDSGVSIKDIYIVNVRESYYETLGKIAKLYQIPIPKLKSESLSNIPYIIDLFSLDYEEIIALLSDYERLYEKYDYVVNIDEKTFEKNINNVISLFNKYSSKYHPNLIKKVVLEDLKITKAYEQYNDNTINIVDLKALQAINSGHIYVINASYSSFPNLVKDNDIITDKEKLLINYPTSETVNNKNNEYLKNIINNSNIEYISFSLMDNYDKYAPSDLLIDLGANNLKNNKLQIEDLNKVYAKNLLMSYFKGSNKNYLLTTFDGSFNISDYEQTIISNDLSKRNIKLSPSAITRYYQSPFIYYLERILKISNFNPTVSQKIGNFFHTLVEIVYWILYENKISRSKEIDKDEVIKNKIFKLIIENSKGELDLEILYDQFLSLYINEKLKDEDKLLKIKTNFYLTKNKDILIKAINFLINLETYDSSDEIHLEKNVNNNLVYGFSDLVTFKNNQIQILDYKSSAIEAIDYNKIMETFNDLLLGSETTNIKNLAFIQVLIYGYLLKNDYPNYELLSMGFFTFFADSLKINAIFKEYPNEHYTKDGRSQRLISEEDEQLIYQNAKHLIEKTIKEILNVNFPVNVLKNVDNKDPLDETWFSQYQALAFFYKIIEEEEDDEDETTTY